MRLLHTMLRVGDLDKSLAFYTEVLNMKLLRRKDYPDGRFTLAFVGYGEERDTTVLEITHNWDTPSYDLGAGYGHISLRCRARERRHSHPRSRADETRHHRDCVCGRPRRLQNRIY